MPQVFDFLTGTNGRWLRHSFPPVQGERSHAVPTTFEDVSHHTKVKGPPLIDAAPWYRS